jgi:hypothetical protein
MGLIVDDDVADIASVPAASEPSAPAPEPAGHHSTLAAPPAPPPDQSDLLDESEPLATSAAHLLKTASDLPPPNASEPVHVEPTETRQSAPPGTRQSSPPRRRASETGPFESQPYAAERRLGLEGSAQKRPSGDFDVARPSAPPTGSAAGGSSPEVNTRPTQFARTGHPVRDRLLARAATAAPPPPPQTLAEPATFAKGEPLPGFSALNAVGDELDEIAAP